MSKQKSQEKTNAEKLKKDEQKKEKQDKKEEMKPGEVTGMKKEQQKGVKQEKSQKRSRTFWMTLIVGGLLVWGIVVTIAYAAYQAYEKEDPLGFLDNQNIDIEKQEIKEIPTSLPRNIDGVMVDIGKENPWITAVMIENLAVSSVRPQHGLSSMPVVYETLAEGGITRFMGLYAGSDERKEIGPVRSARPYYVEIAQEYDALYDHAGGSPQALDEIIRYGIHDLNAIGGGSKYHWRANYKEAPHNLHTDSEKLDLALRDYELTDQNPEYDAWSFKDESEIDNRGEDGKYLKVHFSSPSYESHFIYNKESNTYNRYHGEVAHNDNNTDEQISVKNVIVQHVPAETSGGEKGRILLDLQGEGQVKVFRDGEVIVGTWKKETRDDRTKWYDTDGNEIELNRGNTWVVIVPGDRVVEYN